MRKSFAARRVPRIVSHHGDDGQLEATNADDIDTSQSTQIVKRPLSKPRKSSSLRASIASYSLEAGDDESTSVITPKRAGLSRLAIHRNAEKRTSDLLSTRVEMGRPSYSKDHLDELRQSTPSTPKELESTEVTDGEREAQTDNIRALDIASKFGTDLSRYDYARSSAIPTETEIAEKKARRARLAKENDFISLNAVASDEDDENVTEDEQGRLVLRPKVKYAETRLVRDDEDFMEGFDDSVDDGKISLGRKAEKEAAVKRRKEMAELIQDAEASASDSDDDGEAERNAAYEAAQTRHGTYGGGHPDDHGADSHPKTPPKITPLPSLDGVVERLRKTLEQLEARRMGKVGEMEVLRKEKIRIGEEEVRVQAALKET
ncbi:hypothetical protein LTR28_001455, partial [Elasticomyces elasticus]